MNNLYDQALANMESTVNLLVSRVPPPKRATFKEGFNFRYVEKTIYQALVQKLARLLSSLHAARLLMEHGFVQEQASLQRMLDEMQEDITFLSYSIIFNDTTPQHQAYLDAFFQEEFDADSALESTQKRPMVPRKKIHAYIARIGSTKMSFTSDVEVARTVSKVYSGYIHAASPQIMDMYGGNPPHFHVRGMLGTELHHDHRADLWNCFYRSIIAFSFTAKAFGDEELFTQISNFTRKFAILSGKNYVSTEWGET